MRGAAFGTILVCAAIAAGGSARAASFDCNKAATPDEIAICANPNVSNLDTIMATLYGVRMEIPMLMGARGAARDEQRAWLASRGTCGGSVACLQTSYQSRIAVLQQTISAAMRDYCVKLGIC
jgi:uncharacterized protein